MGSVGEAHIVRSHDRAAGRQPLRLEIGRRRAHTGNGDEKFVTQVRFGDAGALVVPWRDGRLSSPVRPRQPRVRTAGPSRR